MGHDKGERWLSVNDTISGGGMERKKCEALAKWNGTAMSSILISNHSSFSAIGPKEGFPINGENLFIPARWSIEGGY